MRWCIATLNSSLWGRLFMAAFAGTSPAVTDAGPDAHIALSL
jgi:hypothetical protein